MSDYSRDQSAEDEIHRHASSFIRRSAELELDCPVRRAAWLPGTSATLAHHLARVACSGGLMPEHIPDLYEPDDEDGFPWDADIGLLLSTEEQE